MQSRDKKGQVTKTKDVQKKKKRKPISLNFGKWFWLPQELKGYFVNSSSDYTFSVYGKSSYFIRRECRKYISLFLSPFSSSTNARLPCQRAYHWQTGFVKARYKFSACTVWIVPLPTVMRAWGKLKAFMNLSINSPCWAEQDVERDEFSFQIHKFLNSVFLFFCLPRPESTW